MLTLEDCIALSGLTREEIDAIAEHEHLPEIIAMEMGAYLLQLPEGGKAIKAIIRDDIACARMRGDYVHSAKLKLALRHFVEHCTGAVLTDETVERSGATA
jgi:hypothetical protein